jgi:hypothetical protein
MCTNGTTTANSCRSCTDGSTTANACSSCTDGTTANQCTSCTDGTNSIHSTCTQCPGGSTTANSQCPAASPSAQGPDPCQTEQDAFNAADARSHAAQDSLQTLRSLQAALDDQYNAGVLTAATNYGIGFAALATAPVGAAAIYGIAGWSAAVPTAGVLIVETMIKSIGANLATQVVQNLAQNNFDFNDLVSSAGKDTTVQTLLAAARDALTAKAMSSFYPTGPTYNQVQSDVSSYYDAMFSNLGAAINIYRTLGQASTTQAGLDQIRALDNKATSDITTQEINMTNALGDLDNARSAVNYCRGLHPEYNSNSSTSGS